MKQMKLHESSMTLMFWNLANASIEFQFFNS